MIATEAVKQKSGPEVIKHCFMLNPAEHENLNAHKYKTFKKFSILGKYKARMLFFLLINVTMPVHVNIS